jgi:hypothetical protein
MLHTVDEIMPGVYFEAYNFRANKSIPGHPG